LCYLSIRLLSIKERGEPLLDFRAGTSIACEACPKHPLARCHSARHPEVRRKRFKFRLEASLLTMTAGRVFWISPPSEGSKSTHQTSARSIGLISGQISDYSLGPFQGFAFPEVIRGHVPVGGFDVQRHDMGTSKLLDELTDTTATDNAVEAFVNCLTDSNVNGELASHYTYHSYTYSWAIRAQRGIKGSLDADRARWRAIALLIGGHATIELISKRYIWRPLPPCGESITTFFPSGLNRGCKSHRHSLAYAEGDWK
jgi:hypothetical protein